jgi:hypothetical protein
MLLDERYKILFAVLDLGEFYPDARIDAIVPFLATNIERDLVRQAEAEFEDVVMGLKKYLASKFFCMDFACSHVSLPNQAICCRTPGKLC